MGMLSRIFERRSALAPNSDRFWEVFGGRTTTAAGVKLSVDDAMTSTAVWACVRIISESVASLPLFVYRRREDGGKERASDHPLFRLLHDEPNSEMTAYEWRELICQHLTTWGNHYSEIEWGRDGYPIALWPLRPDRMEVHRENGQLVYRYKYPAGGMDTLKAPQVFHVRGMGNGLVGYSPVRMQMEAIALGLATQEFGARFFGNGARPGVILKHPGRLSDDAIKRLRASWQTEHGGLSNAHRTRILEEGMDFGVVGIPPEEAQFLQTRRFQLNEIARIYRIPPHMLGDLERATFSNIEQQSIEFVVHTLRPWLVRIEQAIQRQMMLSDERGTYFVEHVIDGLLRGDITSRYEAYMTGRQGGWLSANDIRALENMNPIEGGDQYLVPLNMVPAGQAGERNAEKAVEWRVIPERRDSDAQVARRRQKLARAQMTVLEDVVGRITRREVNDIRRAVRKYLVRDDDTQGFISWLRRFYEEHASFVARNMRPPLRTIAALVLEQVVDELDNKALAQRSDDMDNRVDEYIKSLGIRWSASGRNQLEALLREAEADNIDAAPVLEERLDRWDAEQPERVGRREAVRSVNFLARSAYILGNVTLFRWNSIGESCPYCDSLDGRVVGVDTPFLEAGSEFQPDGADGPLKVRRRVWHGPAHGGCDCIITAVRG